VKFKFYRKIELIVKVEFWGAKILFILYNINNYYIILCILYNFFTRGE
jgi:hypothetical protein